MGRILEFITFYQNALHLTTLFTRMHCAANISNERASIVRWPDSQFLCGKFSTGRLEVLPNLRHAGVFQMSTMVNFGIGFNFKSLWLVQALNLTRTERSICSSTPQYGGYTNSGNRSFRQRVVSPTVVSQTSLVSSQTCRSQFANV